MASIENEILGAVIQESMETQQAPVHNEHEKYYTKKGLFEKLVKSFFRNGEHGQLQRTINALKTGIADDVFTIEIRRDFIVHDAMREVRKRKFDPKKTMKVIL